LEKRIYVGRASMGRRVAFQTGRNERIELKGVNTKKRKGEKDAARREKGGGHQKSQQNESWMGGT